MAAHQQLVCCMSSIDRHRHWFRFPKSLVLAYSVQNGVLHVHGSLLPVQTTVSVDCLHDDCCANLRRVHRLLVSRSDCLIVQEGEDPKAIRRFFSWWVRSWWRSWMVGTVVVLLGPALAACTTLHDSGLDEQGSNFVVQPAKRLEADPGVFTAVSAGDRHTCGLRPDGTVACWGSDFLVEPRRRPDPSPSSVPGIVIPVGCGRTARWSAGGGMSLARPGRRPDPSLSSVSEHGMPAGCGRTARWPAGAKMSVVGPRRRPDSLPPLAPGSGTPAGFSRAVRWPVGAMMALVRPHRRPDPSPLSVPGMSILAGFSRMVWWLVGAVIDMVEPRHRPDPSPPSVPEDGTPAG